MTAATFERWCHSTGSRPAVPFFRYSLDPLFDPLQIEPRRRLQGSVVLYVSFVSIGTLWMWVVFLLIDEFTTLCAHQNQNTQVAAQITGRMTPGAPHGPILFLGVLQVLLQLPSLLFQLHHAHIDLVCV